MICAGARKVFHKTMQQFFFNKISNYQNSRPYWPPYFIMLEQILQEEKLDLPPWTQDINSRYMRRSEDALGFTSCIHGGIKKIMVFISWINTVTQGSVSMSEYGWLIFEMLDYAWICQNMLNYARICMNMPKSAWMAFILMSLL